MRIASTRVLVGALLVAIGLVATLSISAATPARGEPEVKPLEVTYFFLPG